MTRRHHITETVHSMLESVFRKLKWESKEIKIDGEYLSHLRFADYIVLFAKNTANTKNIIV